jgi:O-acetyl-ADP-ribose deacetylase (regulator of RNase III)
MEIIEGDLLDYCTPFTYIAHQCNCKSKTPKHLSYHVFKRFPHANIYNGPQKYVRNPGTIIVKGTVVNVLAQYNPGKARGIDGEWYPQRRIWLKMALDKILENKEIKTIYFPWGMSCGAAGDDWDKVLPIFEEFNEKMSKEGRKAAFIKL